MVSHKNAEMIKAKVDDMELVVFQRRCIDGKYQWFEDDIHALIDDVNHEHFICLPQHNKNGQCLRWLNGTKTEVKSNLTNGVWDECANSNRPTWLACIGWMREDATYRSKPRKEKRWIGYCESRNQTFPHPQTSKNLAINYAMNHYSYPESDWQFIEIEFEVTE